MHTLLHWEPVQISEDWSDVIAPVGTGEQACGAVLHSLKALELVSRNSNVQRFAVVQLGYHKSVDEFFEGFSAYKALDFPKAAQLQI